MLEELQSHLVYISSLELYNQSAQRRWNQFLERLTSKTIQVPSIPRACEAFAPTEQVKAGSYLVVALGRNIAGGDAILRSLRSAQLPGALELETPAKAYIPIVSTTPFPEEHLSPRAFHASVLIYYSPLETRRPPYNFCRPFNVLA